MNVIHAAEILIEKIKKDYQDDIALLVVMGSYIYSEMHSRSDLDLYFVPKTERGNNLGFTFIIDDIGFDFWPISWDRLERIADFDEKITAIITEGKVLYYSSEADLMRFNELKSKALDISDRTRLINKASRKLDEVYKDYWHLSNSYTISSCRKYAVHIIYTITYALSLLNGIPIKRGRAKLKQEILDMPLHPEGFFALYDVAFTTSDVDTLKSTYCQLIRNTEALISGRNEKVQKPVPFRDALHEFYEELVNSYNKIYHACENNDAVTALLASVELTHEIEQAFKNTGVSPAQLPDLIGTFDPENFEGFEIAAQNHQAELVLLLSKKGVAIRRFKDFDELEEYLDIL
ncbi:MAG: hypothetical protein ACYCYM_06850 [Saccharofermentanales bacterium]